MNVAISINGIFRDLLGKIQEVHQKYYESEIDGELTNKNVKKKLGFKNTKQYLKFLYEEAPMETFGHAKESENNSFIHLNNFLMEHNHLNVTLITDEVGRGIPATLWFLAKYGSQVKNIRFLTKEDKPNVILHLKCSMKDLQTHSSQNNFVESCELYSNLIFVAYSSNYLFSFLSIFLVCF
jgi:hypothetical protein